MTTEQREALIALCLLPDEHDRRRVHHRTQAGDPTRAARLLKFQPTAHAVYQLVARDNELMR